MHLQSETPLNVTKDLNKNYWQTLQGTFTALMNTLNAAQPPSSNCVISRNQIGYICSFLTGRKRALQHLYCCRDAAMFNIVVFNVWTSLCLIEWFWQTFSWTKTHQFCFFSCQECCWPTDCQTDVVNCLLMVIQHPPYWDCTAAWSLLIQQMQFGSKKKYK